MAGKQNSQLVYSTGSGRIRPESAPAASPPPARGDGVVRIGISKQGRGGKSVTTITGVPLAGPELDAYARRIKQKCGCGGSLHEGVIEIQGDKRDLILVDCLAQGWKAKKAGGS